MRLKAPARALVLLVLVLPVLVLLVGGGCTNGDPHMSGVVADSVGDPGRGRQVASDKGCGSCHRIPGVDAEALVGPPLDAWSNRSFIAGSLHNSPANLARWLADPQAVEPGTAMPDLELSQAEIDDLVAYLFTLE